ncbi:MAG: HAMP domain-containing protein [Candidatus Aenigmatarchaeota archaeon]
MRLKFIVLFLVLAIGVTLFFFSLEMYFHQEHLKMSALERVDYGRRTFINFIELDTKTLSSSLNAITYDEEIRQKYMGMDRNALYEYVNPLFIRLKEAYNVTHFYFILPNGTVFLRMHSRDMYGDEVKRSSFLEARDSGKIASEIELGKTAYALRVITPYYDGDSLIGYVELGEEINHFMLILKTDTENEFALIADKGLLDKESWTQIRDRQNLRNNWDDMINHVMIVSTTESGFTAGCFNERTIEIIEADRNYLIWIQNGSKTFVCSGFLITNPLGTHTGSILSLVDVTDQVTLAQSMYYIMIVMGAALFIVVILFGFYVSYLFTRPITELTSASKKVASGKLNVRMSYSSKDEIGELFAAFKHMLYDLKKSRDETDTRNTEIKKSKKELQEKVEELEKFNRFSVGRELKMIELKKNIKNLESKK